MFAVFQHFDSPAAQGGKGPNNAQKPPYSCLNRYRCRSGACLSAQPAHAGGWRLEDAAEHGHTGFGAAPGQPCH